MHREEKKKNAHVSQETLNYLHTVNMHGTQTIEIYPVGTTVLLHHHT